MTNATKFGELSAELVESGAIGDLQKSQVFGRRVFTDAAKDLAQEIKRKMEGVVNIQQVKPPKPLSLSWSLLCNTGYPVTNDSGRKTLFAGLSSVVLKETDPDRLGRRRTLLQHQTAGDIRFLLWLEINTWLSRNNAGIQQQVFEYWDQLPDHASKLTLSYSGEKAKKMSKLVREDIKFLNQLGDFLSKCPALVNNRDVPAQHRVISKEAKAVIDMVLEVGNSQCKCPNTADPNGFWVVFS
jgi:hypothetical protein